MSKQSDAPATVTPAQPDGYADWLKQLKTDIARAQQRAALSVNAELVQLYGRIGRDILLRQEAQGWGAKVIERLARDLKDAFPDMRGFSSRNLKYMAFFAQHCPDGKFGQQPAAQLPWFHIVILLAKLDNATDREWYAAQAVLDARAQFPQSSLADLYDPLTMPPALVKAHQALDRAVDACYRKVAFASDAQRVEYLFERYQQLTSLLPAEKPPKKRKG